LHHLFNKPEKDISRQSSFVSFIQYDNAIFL
jgi:hypothetical protein